DRIIGLYPKNEEPVIRTRLAQTFRYILSQRLIPRADGQGRVAAVEILRSTPRTREYLQNGESEGKTLLDAMRDSKLEGMQDFDSVIKDLIQRKVISLEDGLAFATNQNNLLLTLKGVTAQDDFLRAEDATTPPPPQEPDYSAFGSGEAPLSAPTRFGRPMPAPPFRIDSTGDAAPTDNPIAANRDEVTRLLSALLQQAMTTAATEASQTTAGRH